MKKIKENAKKHALKTKERAKKFNKEFIKAFSTAILAAFGFLIAFVWRDAIKTWVDKLFVNSPVQGQLISALIATIICVLGIILITKLFVKEEKEEEKK